MTANAGQVIDDLRVDTQKRMSASGFSPFSNLREGEGGSGLWEREEEEERKGEGAYYRCS